MESVRHAGGRLGRGGRSSGRATAVGRDRGTRAAAGTGP